MKFGPKEIKELNEYLRTGRNKTRQFMTDLVDDLEPGSLKDELLKDFDPSQETYEEYLQRKSLERPFNMADGGRIPFRFAGSATAKKQAAEKSKKLKDIVAQYKLDNDGKLPKVVDFKRKLRISDKTVKKYLTKGKDYVLATDAPVVKKPLLTAEERAKAYAKRFNAAKAAKEAKFKSLVDKIFETEDFANFKAKVTESQLRAAKRAGKIREGTGIIPAQYIKEFNQAIKAGVDSPEFKNILSITGRSTEDILKLNELRPGGMPTIEVRRQSTIKYPANYRDPNKELKKKETQKKFKVKRAGFEKTAKDFASEADLKDFNLINQGKKNINKFFKNNPDAINDTAFGRNIKNMMAIRVGQDGNFYSRLMPDDYYKKKASEGKLFDIFDMKAVKSGSKFVRVPYNINLTPGQFNSAFIEGQVNKLFTKGVNADAVKNLNNFLIDKNIRVELPNVGYMGAKPDVAATAGTKQGTRTFPRIVETLKKMEAPTNILRNFIDIAPLPGPLKVLKKFADGGLSGGDKSGPPPERGPNPQGLLSLMKRARNY